MLRTGHARVALKTPASLQVRCPAFHTPWACSSAWWAACIQRGPAVLRRDATVWARRRPVGSRTCQSDPTRWANTAAVSAGRTRSHLVWLRCGLTAPGQLDDARTGSRVSSSAAGAARSRGDVGVLCLDPETLRHLLRLAASRLDAALQGFRTRTGTRHASQKERHSDRWPPSPHNVLGRFGCRGRHRDVRRLAAGGV